MSTQRPFPRRFLVALAVLAGSASMAAGVASAASSDDATSPAPVSTVPNDPAPTEPSQTEPPTTAPGLLDDEVGCETVFEAGNEADFDQYFAGLDESEQAELTEEFVETSSAFVIGDSPITVSVNGEEDFAAYVASLDETEKADLVAAMNELTDEIAAELDAEGVDYTREADPVIGVEWPTPTDPEWAGGEGEATFLDIGEDGCAGVEIVSEELSDAEFQEYLNSLSPEERTELIDQMTADAADFKKHLDDSGVAYTLETDPATGVEWPCPGDSVDGTDNSTGTSFEYELGEPLSPDSAGSPDGPVLAEPGQ